MSDTEYSESSEESCSDGNSDAFEYSSSSDSDSDSISSQDDAEEFEIPEDYEPEGAESDDDRHKCCHWTTQQQQHSTVRRRSVLDMGGPSQRYQDGTSPSDLVELVLDHTFLDRVIRCTNNHGQGGQKYSHLISNVFGRCDIPCNDFGRSFIKGFFALKVYAGLMGVRNMQEAWSQKDPLKASESKIVFCSMQLKHTL